MTARMRAKGEDAEQGAIGHCRTGRRLWLRGSERLLHVVIGHGRQSSDKLVIANRSSLSLSLAKLNLGRDLFYIHPFPLTP